MLNESAKKITAREARTAAGRDHRTFGEEFSDRQLNEAFDFFHVSHPSEEWIEIADGYFAAVYWSEREKLAGFRR